MDTRKEFYECIDGILLKSFFTLSKIIKSKDSSYADKIQAINALITLRTKIKFVLSEETN